jgi:Tfp pilus assembly protein PilX
MKRKNALLFWSSRKGFTLLFVFLSLIVVAFMGLFSQSAEIYQVLRMQKKVLRQNAIETPPVQDWEINFQR